jgi:hypothetical protein
LYCAKISASKEDMLEPSPLRLLRVVLLPLSGHNDSCLWTGRQRRHFMQGKPAIPGRPHRAFPGSSNRAAWNMNQSLANSPRTANRQRVIAASLQGHGWCHYPAAPQPNRNQVGPGSTPVVPGSTAVQSLKGKRGPRGGQISTHQDAFSSVQPRVQAFQPCVPQSPVFSPRGMAPRHH